MYSMYVYIYIAIEGGPCIEVQFDHQFNGTDVHGKPSESTLNVPSKDPITNSVHRNPGKKKIH